MIADRKSSVRTRHLCDGQRSGARYAVKRKYKGMGLWRRPDIFKDWDDSNRGGASTSAISAAIRAAVDGFSYNANIVTMSYGGFNTYNDGSEEECQAS